MRLDKRLKAKSDVKSFEFPYENKAPAIKQAMQSSRVVKEEVYVTFPNEDNKKKFVIKSKDKVVKGDTVYAIFLQGRQIFSVEKNY